MSIKKNFLYNMVLTGANYIFPLITFPYITRNLGAKSIGICNFADSLIGYVILLSSLGIGSYGVREVARVRNDKNKLDEVFSSLVAWNIILSVFFVLLFLISIFVSPRLQEEKDLLLVGISRIVFSIILVEWLFQGLEKFKYITVRSIIIRLVYVVSVFIFIRSTSDVFLYFFILTLITVINGIVNWNYSHRIVHFSVLKVKLRPYLVPILSFGYYMVLTSFYTLFNNIFLGFISTDSEVGYFSTAAKIVILAGSVFSAFTTVMIPRICQLLEKENDDELQKIASISFEGMICVAAPIAIFCLFYAEEIIFIIAGNGFEGSIVPFKIISPLILIIGLEQIAIRQFLMANKHSNTPLIILSSVGAFVGIVSNICFTSQFASIGSSISWLLSECAVLIMGIIFLSRITRIRLEVNNLKSLIKISSTSVVLCLLCSYIPGVYLRIIIALIAIFVSIIITILRSKNLSYLLPIKICTLPQR